MRTEHHTPGSFWRLRAVPLAAAILLAACAAHAPETRRPAVALPAQFAGASGDANAAISPRWWTLFGDAELDRLVTEANALLDPYGAKAEPLKEAAHFIAYRKK